MSLAAAASPKEIASEVVPGAYIVELEENHVGKPLLNR